MKKNIKSIIEYLATKENVNRYFTRVGQKIYNKFIYFQNKHLFQYKDKIVGNDIVERLFSTKTVLEGPFKGMVYPELAAVGSTIYPKLLGSYESELHPVIELIISENYKQLIDIGCAEGYYAVGFAIRCPKLQVFAFDVNEEALLLCSKMAELNNVNAQIKNGTFCSTQTLKEFNYTSKTLILCDCEGYESKLFNDDSIAILSNSDLLIEVHDVIKYDIGSKLIKLFSDTHHINIIKSINDFKKPYIYSSMYLEGLNYDEKYGLLAELRVCDMEWFYFTSKKDHKKKKPF